MPYDVVTPVFEGPLDLLLHLVSREQVDLWEVPLARIVDGFVVELDRMDQLDLDVATEFLLTLAVLVELKSRRMLPGQPDLDAEEELGLWEHRDLLIARLLECKTFKDAARELEKMADRAGLAMPRTAGIEEEFLEAAPDMLAGVTPERLAAALTKALAPKPVARIDLDHVAPIRLSVTDAVAELVVRLPHLGPTSFRELAADAGDRLTLIVRFLAVLELYKQGLVDLEQGELFGSLHVVWTGGDDFGAVDDLLVEEYQG